LQVWHDVETSFQNYFVALYAWRAVAERHTEFGLQLLDLG
jgi:hypothetical protein